jgi:hypothetical protein
MDITVDEDGYAELPLVVCSRRRARPGVVPAAQSSKPLSRTGQLPG